MQGVRADPQAGAGGVLKPPVSFLGCRGLRFIQVFLQSICDGERDESHPNHIRVNATKAYEMALKKYHGWIVQKIFQVRPVLSPGPGESLACGVHSPLCHSLAVAQEGLPCPCGGRLVHRGALSLTCSCPAPPVAMAGVLLHSPWCSVLPHPGRLDWGAMGETPAEALRISG